MSPTIQPIDDILIDALHQAAYEMVKEQGIASAMSDQYMKIAEEVKDIVENGEAKHYDHMIKGEFPVGVVEKNLPIFSKIEELKFNTPSKEIKTYIPAYFRGGEIKLDESKAVEKIYDYNKPCIENECLANMLETVYASNKHMGDVEIPLKKRFTLRKEIIKYFNITRWKK